AALTAIIIAVTALRAATRTPALIVTTTAQQRQIAREGTQHDLGRIAVLAGLILPVAGFQLALDIDGRSLAQILLGDFRERFREDRDRMPIGALLALARRAIAPGLGGGDAQIADLAAIGEAAHLGVAAE